MTSMIATINDDPEEHDAKIALYAAEERRVYEGFIESVIQLRDESDPANRKQLARAVKVNFKHYLKINQDMSLLLGASNEMIGFYKGQLRDALAAIDSMKDAKYDEAKGILMEIAIANLEDFFRVNKTAAYRFAKLVLYGEADGVLLDNLHVIGECIEVELGGDNGVGYR